MIATMKKYRAFCFHSFSNFSTRHTFNVLGLAFVYFISAHFGLTVSAVNKFAALVWPPSGIALATLLIFNRNLWPGIFLGAFLVNFIAGASFFASIGISIGSTLEAVVGATLFYSVNGTRNALEKVRDVSRLVVIAITCTLISATLGVGSLWLSRAFDLHEAITYWIQWWVGDALGILAITPLLIVHFSKNSLPRFSLLSASWFAKLSYGFALVGVSMLVLGSSPVLATLVGAKNLYILFPLLLWGAMRFGQLGSVTTTFVISIMAMWNTSQGFGPFADSTTAANVYLLVFVVVVSVTGLFLGAMVSEREREQVRLRQSDLDLKAAKEAAEAANLAKSAFLANMSHEIRSPLGAVMGFSELVADGGLAPKEQATFVAAIKRNGELLLNLINDILDLSKVEAGKIEIQKRQLSIAELLKDVEATLTQQALSKNINLIFKIHPLVPSIIFTDPLRLRQILINVIGNALKFTGPQGKVSVDVHLISKASGGAQVSFVVKDSGIGIRFQDAKNLFTSFSQVDPSAKRKYGGTGLGLVLSRRLAQLLGGTVILAESEIDKGSTFVISIDSGDLSYSKMAVPTKVTEIENQQLPRLDGLNVLLVEDSLDNQYLVNQMLSLAGAQVEIANNGQEAVERALSRTYNVILMDLQMPVMDGYEAISKLRAAGYTGSIIALTAHALSSERERCLASGFDEHLSKPINRHLLLSRVSQLAKPILNS